MKVSQLLNRHAIKSTPHATDVWDVMQGCERFTIDVDGQAGFVSLVDVMPRICPVGQFADYAIVQAARVSYGQGTKQVSEDEGLIRYLYRHLHTTPSEMVELKFHCQMPIFVARQLIRHRTANVNELSARYSVVKDLRWVPPADSVRAASNKNKQVSEGSVDAATAEAFTDYVREFGDESHERYQKFVDAGVGRELARVALPLNTYTEWYWKIDLHNLFHFLGLRMHEHAQKETRDYADAMFSLVAPLVPTASQAFLDYHHHMGGMKLTALEIEAVRAGRRRLATDNKREQAEFEDKARRLELWNDLVEE